MVECEYDRDPESHSGGCSFNRYMVECEFVQSIAIGCKAHVLIDTWWNVNNIFAIFPAEIIGVLIDTWWNVNDVALAFENWEQKVLIDTWWNVNMCSGWTSIRLNVCFNRYMVECEC